MRQDIPLGRIRGIRVGSSWSVVLIAALYLFVLADRQFPVQAPEHPVAAYWVAGCVGMVAFLASLFAHEIAHALMALRHGIGVRRITLWLLGGFAELESEPRTAGQQFMIAAVGPVTNLAIGGVLWGVHRAVTGRPELFTVSFEPMALWGAVLGWLAFVNLLLGAFNLLPAAPLDGGRLFGAGIWAVTGNRDSGVRWAAWAGVVLGAAGIAWGFTAIREGDANSGFWAMVIGWWIAAVAFGDLSRSAVRSVIGSMRASDVMRHDPMVVPADTTVEAMLATRSVTTLPDAVCTQLPDGRITGLLTSSQLAGIDPTAAASVPVGRLAFPVDRVRTVSPDTGGPELVAALHGDPVGRLLVLHPDGRVVGTVGPRDLDVAVRRAWSPAALLRGPRRPPDDPGSSPGRG